MLKSFIVGVILLNYFLVVVVTNITTANAVKYTHAYAAENPYAHAPDCQQKYYLQFDCFDKCNNQEKIDSSALPLDQYVLLLANGLDFHNLGPLYLNNKKVISAENVVFPCHNLLITAGFVFVDCPPPNIGYCFLRA